MSVFNSMQINATGLTLERLKMDTISTNIANINTTRTPEGGPYRRKEVVFEENLIRARKTLDELPGRKSAGVRVVGVEESQEELRLVYDPEHPDANEEGYVEMPNVNMVDEMISLIQVQRTYDANVTALNASKSMLKKALEISKG